MKFQFKYCTIKSKDWDGVEDLPTEFQFKYCTIKSQTKTQQKKEIRYFNSSIVRLKAVLSTTKKTPF